MILEIGSTPARFPSVAQGIQVSNIPWAQRGEPVVLFWTDIWQTRFHSL